MIRRAVVISNHLAGARRRTSIHFIARALRDLGWSVAFVTVGLSPISKLRGDGRLREPALEPRNRWVEMEPGLSSFVWYAPFHPANLRVELLNRMTAPLFRAYPRLIPATVRSVLAIAELVVIETGAGISLVPTIRRVNRTVPLIYRVSDTVGVLNPHPVLVEAETLALPELAAVSCASDRMRDTFPAGAPTFHHPHGLEPPPDETPDSPYAPDEVAVVSMGSMLFDAETARRACRAAPNVRFHFFGHGDAWPREPNAVVHGEVAFETLRPYLRHAAAGAAFYLPAPGAEYLAETSNKMMHFAAYRLPIIAPRFVAEGRSWIAAYDQSDQDGVGAAVARALAMERDAIAFPDFPTWDQVTRQIVDDSLQAASEL